MEWNILFSIITSGIALLALFQTQKQIRLSNKQNLFDKRVENYLIVDGLIKLYEEHDSLFSDDTKLTDAVDYKFTLMTNNSFLENIAPVIKSPLSNLEQKEFLIKLEEIKNIAMKIRLIFNGKPAEQLGNFTDCYGNVLFVMYQYQILNNKMLEASQKYNWTLEEAKEELDEKVLATKLKLSFDNLRKSYELLNNEKIRKEIRLK